MPGKMIVKGGVKKATIEATIIRADGTEEHLGVVSSYERPRTFKEIVEGIFKNGFIRN